MLKNNLVKQFYYCNAIANDIIKHNKSKEIQEYAKQFFLRSLIFEFPPIVRQSLFLQACPPHLYCIGYLYPQRYFF